MSSNGVIIFGHGAKDPKWEGPIRSLAKKLSKELAPVKVTVAFLQFGTPKIEEAVFTHVESGATKIMVLPFFISSGGHLKKELPEILKKMEGRFPKVKFVLSPALGQMPLVIDAMTKASADFVQARLG